MVGGADREKAARQDMAPAPRFTISGECENFRDVPFAPTVRVPDAGIGAHRLRTRSIAGYRRQLVSSRNHWAVHFQVARLTKGRHEYRLRSPCNDPIP
jgi:hypothetical protein